MLNDNRFKMLAKMAMFEKKTGQRKEQLNNTNYTNYMLKGVWWTIFTSSLAFIFAWAIYAICKGSFDEQFSHFLNRPVCVFSKAFIWIIYAIYELIFILIALVFYSKKFNKMKPELDVYHRRQINYSEFYGKKDKKSGQMEDV